MVEQLSLDQVQWLQGEGAGYSPFLSLTCKTQVSLHAEWKDPAFKEKLSNKQKGQSNQCPEAPEEEGEWALE